MSLLPAVTEISDSYPNPSNAIARTGFARLWTAINEFFQKPETDLASASTLDIGAQATTKLRITGSTTITSLGSTYRGPIKLRFSGTPILTHNATTLRLPGAANIAVVAGDVFEAWPTSTTSGTADGWQMVRLSTAGGDVASATNRGYVELATDAEAQTGTDATRAVTPDNLGAVVPGMGQVWTEVKTTPGRAVSTTYTNSTGRTKLIVVSGNLSAASAALQISVNGGLTAYSNAAYTNGMFASAQAVVPPGATYAVTASTGTFTISSWMELI